MVQACGTTQALALLASLLTSIGRAPVQSWHYCTGQSIAIDANTAEIWLC